MSESESPNRGTHAPGDGSYRRPAERAPNSPQDRGHGGNLEALAAESGIPADRILDFSANLNPLGAPSWLRSVVNRRLEELFRYPDPSYGALVAAIAEFEGVDVRSVVVGNGSTELIYVLPRLLTTRFGSAVVVDPAYSDYRRASLDAGLAVRSVRLTDRPRADGFQRSPAEREFPLDPESLVAACRNEASIVWLGRPANPTGTMPSIDAVRDLAEALPECVIVVDESFLQFVDGARSCASLAVRGNVVVLRSMTKFYAVPGLRLGYAVCSASLAERIRASLPTWSVNALAAEFGRRALADAEYADRSREFVRKARLALVADLSVLAGTEEGVDESAVPLAVCPSAANYLLIRLGEPLPSADLVRRGLLSRGIAVRSCGDFVGLDDRWIRIAVRTPAENARFTSALREVLDLDEAVPATAGRPGARPTRRGKALMIQGTASNAGKSVLAAAFCRILLREGYRVAPFKAQNMSLNSYVTADGGEMGRAQVVQAQACRLEPDVRMNPILLKPSSEMGSQIIVLGKAIENMEARRYFRAKRQFFDTVKQSYDELASEFDVVVLEGAGSPGEVNLKSHDIVNMQMAAYAGAPVLLAGDIDRGGVFASFIGTMDVLDEWERALVAGFLVNKFRGDPSLLGDALDYTLEYTGRPVLGVVPMISDLGLPEEDSVSFKEFRGRMARGGRGTAESSTAGEASSEAPPGHAVVRIGFIDLPHVSNFTDVDALRIEPDVEIVVVRSQRDLPPEWAGRAVAIGSPGDEGGLFDALILPGSKSVAADLESLRRHGLADAVVRAAYAGTMIVGICGGFQMLGERIEDPDAVESSEREVRGLGLLGVRTTMGRGKVLRRRAARHSATGTDARGYEIHHGRTVLTDAVPDFLSDDGEPLGAAVQHRSGIDPGGAAGEFPRVWGTYLHGVFDSDEFRRAFVDALRTTKGLAPLGTVQAAYEIESALDRLADTVRDAVDMDAIHRMLDAGVEPTGA